MSRLTPPRRRALQILADCSQWVSTGTSTQGPPSHHYRINGSVAQTLEKLGLAKSRAELWGEPIRGADLARYLGSWHTAYTITRKGMKAIGRVGEVLR